MGDRDRDLWAAVVLQARDDVAELPIDSVEYLSAVSFLTSETRYWRAARADIAAHLLLHGDDIRRAGLKWVNARRLAAGLEDPAPPPARVIEPVAAAAAPPADVADYRPLAGWARRRRLPEQNPFARRFAA